MSTPSSLAHSIGWATSPRCIPCQERHRHPVRAIRVLTPQAAGPAPCARRALPTQPARNRAGARCGRRVGRLGRLGQPPDRGRRSRILRVRPTHTHRPGGGPALPPAAGTRRLGHAPPPCPPGRSQAWAQRSQPAPPECARGFPGAAACSKRTTGCVRGKGAAAATPVSRSRVSGSSCPSIRDMSELHDLDDPAGSAGPNKGTE